MTEREAMRRALALAVHGWGHVAPNPLVGAVLLKDGSLVGEGFHAVYGGPHAEVVALETCANPRGATCVVTLEPCAHQGKTPPCTEALIAAGVAKVVLAVRDPHRIAAGGIDRLRDAGVAVEVGLERHAAAALNAPFLWNTVRPERPFVALKVATSLDGFLADRNGRSQWISSEPARDFVHWLRAGFQAIGVGRRTVDRDDPRLTVRGPVTPRAAPVRIVFSTRGSLPSDSYLARTAGEIPTIVSRIGTGRSLHEAPAVPGLEVVDAASLDRFLRALRGRGLDSILIEGGGALATALLEQDLVDRVYWVQAPVWLGAGIRAFGDRTGLLLPDVHAWTVTERRVLGPDTLLVVDRELCLQES